MLDQVPSGDPPEFRRVVTRDIVARFGAVRIDKVRRVRVRPPAAAHIHEDGAEGRRLGRAHP